MIILNKKYSNSKDNLNSLVGSHTVIDGKKCLISGFLSYIEGDIMEVETKQYSYLNLGDPVKVIIYSSVGGIIVFESTVVARDKGSIFLLVSKRLHDKFTEKRLHTRVDVDIDGAIHSIQHQTEINTTYEVIKVTNISLGGIGFTIPNNISLQENNIIESKIVLGEEIDCKAKIVRRDAGDEIYYGAEFTHVPIEKINSLRAYILKVQIERRNVAKKEEFMKSLEEKQSIKTS